MLRTARIAALGASYSIDPAGAPVRQVTGCKNAVGDEASRLQLVAATESIPNDVLAVREGFPEARRSALLAAAQGLEKSDPGQRTLATAFHAEGFTAVSDEDYAPVRAALLVFKH